MKVLLIFILALTSMVAYAATLPKVFLRGFLPSYIHGMKDEAQNQRKPLEAIDGNLDVVQEPLVGESNKNIWHKSKVINQMFERMIRRILDEGNN